MKIIADFHIHSRYARACSIDLTPVNLSLWAQKKGINILGTGDFTHPAWLSELKENLEEEKPGLYKLKNSADSTLFFLTAELASIYKQGDKVRRVHNLVFAPNFSAVDKLISLLERRGVNLKSDGRPMMGVPCEELLKICKDADENIELVPAHAWTPHFGVFGSLSGFDSLQEAFGEMTKYIFAIETGLSSDPKMNWQVGELDDITLISNSDAHSLRKLGREANVFDIDEEKLSYKEIIRVLKDNKPSEFLETIEFFPEEGKYYFDGHADCKFSCEPLETKKLSGICPICKKKLLRGVMSRADDLSSLPLPRRREPGARIPFRSIIPLEEIIAETFGVGPTSKKVITAYEDMISKSLSTDGKSASWRKGEGGFHGEFKILLDTPREQLSKLSSDQIAESIIRVREGKVKLAGGYDGVFGKIHIYSEEERLKMNIRAKSSTSL